MKSGASTARRCTTLHHRLAPQAGDLYHYRTLGRRGNGRKYTQGMTVVDYYHLTGNPPNTTLMLDVDREAFVDLLAQRLAFYA
jgi:hypothetical protein